MFESTEGLRFEYEKSLRLLYFFKNCKANRLTSL